MLPIFHIIVLSIIQGLTEFLPISSSAHLIVLPPLLGWADQGLDLDIAVHVGSLAAVMVYFYRDVGNMLIGTGHLLTLKNSTERQDIINLVIATIPVVIVGGIASYIGIDSFRTMMVIGAASIFFGVVLYFADTLMPEKRDLNTMTPVRALLVGIAQSFSIVPGTSRAGSCITALRVLGFTRTGAAKYSCFMSIPTIFAAGTLLVGKYIKMGSIDL
ncbi:MAG: undecaprenyl-diphosphate phosphatase, partial [Alphaproteobacteria bacterium]